MTDLIALSNRRKEAVKDRIDSACFPGMNGRVYRGVIDAFHGETCFSLDQSAQVALARTWHEILRGETAPCEPNGRLYDKQQPRVLRELAATRLFRQLERPRPGVEGVRVGAEEVVVCPYTSTILLEEALATLVRPGGVIACPEGFYKNNGTHVEKLELRIATFPVASASFKIDPDAMAQRLRHYRVRGELCGVLLTMPGNPVPVDYEREELENICRLLIESETRVVCDAAFDALVPDYLPIASLRVKTATGEERLYDRVLTITGNSKGHNAFGPCKLGAACSGDTAWLAVIRDRLTCAFQRETTHLIRAVLEETSDEYLAQNIAVMRAQQAQAREHIADINRGLSFDALSVCGTSAEGMFLTVRIDPTLLVSAGVTSSLQLEDLLLVAAGIDSVCLRRMGSPLVGVRLNILAPRKGIRKDPANLDELFDRLERLVSDLSRGLTYRQMLAGVGLAPAQWRELDDES